MGMSASQARFLQLTSQMNDLEFEAQQINFQRTQLAKRSSEASKAYTESISNTGLFFKAADSREYSLTYQTLTQPAGKDTVGLGMFLTTVDGKTVVADDSEIPAGANRTDYIVDKNLAQGKYFEDALKDGVYLITQRNNESIVQKSISQLHNVYEAYLTMDDAKAEALYKNATDEIQEKDKLLELELTSIETKHEALQTEIDSVQKVIEKNIETTFNTFS